MGLFASWRYGFSREDTNDAKGISYCVVLCRSIFNLLSRRPARKSQYLPFPTSRLVVCSCSGLIVVRIYNKTEGCFRGLASRETKHYLLKPGTEFVDEILPIRFQ